MTILASLTAITNKGHEIQKKKKSLKNNSKVCDTSSFSSTKNIN